MDLKKLVVFLKKMLKCNVAIGLLLSFLANAIIQLTIPGTTVLELVLGVIITAIITYLSSRLEKNDGLVMSVYEGAIA